MRINWCGYYNQNDGYGRFNSRMVEALRQERVDVKIITPTHYTMPSWMLEDEHVDLNDITISCLPGNLVQPFHNGRHWLYTMTEGSAIPASWVEQINRAELDKILTPSVHSALALVDGGVNAPVHVVPGGTDFYEFPPITIPRPERPYTFLTLADRGFRKGWEEAWKAFYSAFGGKTTGVQDVRMIIKSLPSDKKSTLLLMSQSIDADARFEYQVHDAPNMYDVYAQADCVVLPSRSEGWGMPHREAACMGLPVITQQYAGLNDGFIEQWSIPITEGKILPIPKECGEGLGEWRIANHDELVTAMKMCYNYQGEIAGSGKGATRWIKNNQTWRHSAVKLMQGV